MAKDDYHNLKRHSLLFGIYFSLLGTIIAQNRAALIETAKKDIGMIEGKDNTGKTQKYVKYWNSTETEKLSLQSPYCGLAINYWYKQTGIDHKIKFSPRAYNFYTYCRNPKSFALLTIKQLADIPKGSVIVFKNSWGHHVGLLDRVEGNNIYTIEANTSNARSITKYPYRSEGVFYLKTDIHNRSLKPIYYCDCLTN